MTAQVMIAMGGNLGNVAVTFAKAVLMLSADVFDVRRSDLYRTAPHFDKPNATPCQMPDYLNAVMIGCTYWEPEELLHKLLDVEEKLGRSRNEPCAPRTLDLDLLLYNDRIIETENLVLPHPRMHLRNFVLTPAAEIAPNWMHPIFNCTIEELSKRCSDNLPIERLQDLI